MENFKYGVKEDIKRLNSFRGGYCLCKLDKMPQGILTDMDNARVCDINHPLASTITARYHKGIGGHKDNMVLVWKKQDF